MGKNTRARVYFTSMYTAKIKQPISTNATRFGGKKTSQTADEDGVLPFTRDINYNV